MFDVEESQYPCDQRPCCGETWLSLSSVRSGTFLSDDHTIGVGVNNEGQVVNARYCGRNLQIPPLFFTGTGLIVTFKSGHNTSGARGFRIDYLIGKNVCMQIHVNTIEMTYFGFIAAPSFIANACIFICLSLAMQLILFL